jgi:NAD(P)H-nitrite reductase large subunit
MRPVPIFPNAYRQGLIAGYNMAVSERRFEGALVMNSVEVFGLPTISVGLTDPERVEDYEIMSCFDVDTLSYKKIVLKGNVVVGAIFIGDIDRAGIFTGLIKGEVNVAGAKDTLLSDDFGLINLPAEYRKHVVSGLGIEV